MPVKTQLEDIQNYLTDSSNMQGGNAERLFIPESSDEIAAILKDANEQCIAVTSSPVLGRELSAVRYLLADLSSRLRG